MKWSGPPQEHQHFTVTIETGTGSAAGGGAPAVGRPADWVAAWRAWAASHRGLAHPADDGREAIYADRGA